MISPIFVILFLIVFFAGFWWGCENAERYWKQQFKNFTDTTNEEYRKCITEIEKKHKGSAA